MKMMRISIAMATYNGAQYIQDQLNSFQLQTRQPDELIVYDDCSTDETESIVSKFSEACSFKVFFYKNKKNIGFKQNFAQALSKCTGDLIFLSDQDDVWLPRKIEKIVSFFDCNPTTMVVTHDQIICDSKLRHLKNTRFNNLSAINQDLKNHVSGCCTALRGSWVKMVLPMPIEINAHDTWIATLADKIGVRELYKEPLMYYRRHDKNASQSVTYSINPITRDPFIDTNLLKKIRRTRNFNISNINREIRVLEVYIERVKKIDDLKLANEINNAALRFLMDSANRISWLKSRKEILNKKFPSRLKSVIKFYLAGFYKKSNGIYSAIADAISL